MAQFASIYKGHPWYGDSICHLLDRVTPAIAFRQSAKETHSIAQIVFHIIYWRQSLIKRLEGDLAYQPTVKSENNWKSNHHLKKYGWKIIKQNLHESQAQLLSLLARQKDAFLKTRYSNKVTFEELINGILQHDLYHTGQIAYLISIHSKKKI